jgi:hypothetical protein
VNTRGRSQSLPEGGRRITSAEIMLNITEKMTNQEEQILGLSVPANDCGVFPDIEKMKVNICQKTKVTI